MTSHPSVASPPPAKAAIAYMVGASALVAATSIMAKAMAMDTGDQTGLHPLHQSAGRFWFALIALLCFLALRRGAPLTFQGANWRLHVMRTILGWLTVTLLFAAVSAMPVAEATAISFLSPLVTMGLAVLMLSERLAPRRILAAALAVTGALLILRPGTDTFQIAGLFALASAVTMGFETIYIKRLSDREPALRIIVLANVIGAGLSLATACFVWIWPSPEQWGLLVALGVTMLCAQALFIQSMKRGDASFVTPVFYSVLVFAALYDFALYGVVPGVFGTAGASLILAGALLLATGRTRMP